MKIGQVSLSGAMRALVLGSAFAVAALAAALSVGTPADAAKPYYVQDMCSETSGGDPGLECNSSEDFLVRPKYADGTCGDWICCPPNGNGTYDCNRGSSPGGSKISNRVRRLLGPHAAVMTPNRAPRPGKAPVVQGQARTTTRN